MTSPEGTVGPEYVAALREKWGLGETPSVRTDLTAILLENQDRHFNRLVEEPGCLDASPWRQGFCDALKSQLQTHALPELCSMQPMTGPIGFVHYYQHRSSGLVDGVPEIQLEFTNLNQSVQELQMDIREIQAVSRSCRTLFGDHSSDDVLEMMVEELLTEISREILGTMLNCATGNNGILEVQDGGDLKEALTRASQMVHRRSQRAPANKLIGNEAMLTQLGICVPISNGQVQSIGAVDDQRVAYLDPLFPKGQLMAWYQGDSPYDTGFVYSPYTLVEITPNFVDPGDQTLRRTLRVRHRISPVRPEFVALIRTPAADPLPA